MGRKRKVPTTLEEAVVEVRKTRRVAKAFEPGGLQAIQAENAKLRAELAKVRPKWNAPSDGAVTFKSPWPRFQQRLRRSNRIRNGHDEWSTESPVFAEFDNQVCTLQPGDVFLDFDGKVVRKIDRMREIYKEMVARRKRPHFIEVTGDVDLKVKTFRERIPPAAMVEFRGPLFDMPEIPPPPPKEAKETMDTLEGRRSAY